MWKVFFCFTLVGMKLFTIYLGHNKPVVAPSYRISATYDGHLHNLFFLKLNIRIMTTIMMMMMLSASEINNS